MYGVHQRVAGTFRQGRFLLAGDAAHLNSPIGGVGMNSGIHDGLNLAAKLRLIWDGADADMLLDRYDRQRRETAIKYVQAQTIANKRTLEENDPEARKRNFEHLRHQANDPDLARDYARRGALVAMWRESEAIA
jgi:3-(3-hydroxy-phenyl)propionate hydroxylase